jgi:hypothetical protein
MTPTYILYLITFLGFPILGFIIARHLDFEKSKKYLRSSFLVFVVHNILFFFGLSFKGDYSDYFVFSLEYLFLSLVICLLYKLTSSYAKILRTFGTIALVIGFLQGLIGIVMFIVISQDFETDTTYHFSSNNMTYQSRRYSFGFATLDDTRYTFETYREYDYLPFEKLINETDLFEFKSGLDFKNININIKYGIGGRILEFSSPNGKIFTTSIE